MNVDDFHIISIDIEEGNSKTDVSKSVDSLNINQRKSQFFDEEQHEQLSVNNSTTWNSLTSSIISLKDNLMYNYLTFNYSYDIMNNPIQLFDKHFSPYKRNKLEKYLNLLFMMTYRTGFSPILNNDNKKLYTSDCGWGCMVRCGQMMLAKAILEFKLYAIDKNYNKTDVTFTKDDLYSVIDENLIRKSRIDTIMLFFDNPINVSDVYAKEEFYAFIEEQYVDLTSNVKIIPPFSLLNIFTQGRDVLHKEPGEWFSDINLIKVFYAVQKTFKNVTPFEIFYFTEGFIDEKFILSRCFVEQNLCSLNILTRKNKKYSFTKGGIIFVSVRLGLDSIEKDYYESIKSLFDIKGNIGMIGGKTNKAYYFIGKCNEGLLYLDPHISQYALEDKSKLDISANYKTYSVKKIYVLDIAYLSPCFTIGFMYKDYDEYIRLIEDLLLYQSQNESFPICKFNMYK